MASAAEQLAANFSMSHFGKAKELQARLWYTLGALIIFRLGTYIPLPGIEPGVLASIFQKNAAGILGIFDMFSGGALARMSVFALNIMPYISASIIIQLISPLFPPLEALRKEGNEASRRKLNQYTRYLTIVICLIQAYGMAVGLEKVTGAHGMSAVINPGLGFIFTTVITLLGGTMFILWLADQITQRGIGQGSSILIFAGIVAQLPHGLMQIFELGRTGAISTLAILAIIIGVVGLLGAIVFMERAYRKVIVQYPKRQVGMKVMGGESSHMPLKLNTAGVIPPIFASSILSLPLMFLGFIGADAPEWLQAIANQLHQGQLLHMCLFGALIVFFCFFYTAIVFNPQETAENLRKHGGFIPGIRPGKNTADYFDYILTRLTVIGAAYIAAVCLLPEFLIGQLNLPFYFGGTSVLIVVSVTMETVNQIQSHLLAQQYEGLLKKARLSRSKSGAR